MYPQIPAGYGLARIHFTLNDGSGHAYVIQGFENGTSLDPDPAAHAIGNTYTGSGSIASNMSTTATLADVTTVVNLGGTLSEGIFLFGVAGGAESDIMPPNCAVLVRKGTAVLGRHGRGRLYFPYQPIALLSSGNKQLTPSAFAGFQTVVQSLLTAQGLASVPMVLLHRNVAIPPTLVTSLTVEQEIATQRRRLRKAPHR